MVITTHRRETMRSKERNRRNILNHCSPKHCSNLSNDLESKTSSRRVNENTVQFDKNKLIAHAEFLNILKKGNFDHLLDERNMDGLQEEKLIN